MDKNKNLLSMLWSAAIVICVLLSIVALGVSAIARPGAAAEKGSPRADKNAQSTDRPASPAPEEPASDPAAEPVIDSVAADRTAAKPGETVTWTAGASGGSGTLRYCFCVYKDGAVLEKGRYGDENSFSFTPSEAGSYAAKAFVRDGEGTKTSRMGDTVTVG